MSNSEANFVDSYSNGMFFPRGVLASKRTFYTLRNKIV